MPWTRNGDPAAVNPRSLQGEAAWIPVELDQLIAISEIVEERFTAAQAAGVANWLLKKAAGKPDTTSKKTRSQYRKILAELDAAGIQPPKPTGGSRIRQGVEALTATGVEGIGEKAEELVQARALAAEAGQVDVGFPLVIVALALAAAAVSRTGSVGAGLAFAALDVTSIPGDEDSGAGEWSERAGQGLAEVVPMRRAMRIVAPVDAYDDAHDLAA